MILALLLAVTPSTGPAPNEALARAMIGEAALALTLSDDPAWHPEQRDCAGLVRYAYRQALLKLDPERVKAGLWETPSGRAGFADAQTLLRENFVRVSEPRSGDVAAFARGEDVFHLMLVVTQHSQRLVVYATGNGARDVRAGPLEALRDAPKEWQPQPDNSAFLGFFRWKEWP